MMIPYGYKQTEAGVIPEDWECTTAKQLMKIETGSRNTENKTNTGIYPFFVRSQKIESIDTYHYNCEAVLTAGDGVGTGKVFHYYIGKFDAHQRVYVMSGFNGISGRYFYYYFSENFEKEVSKYTAKSSVDSVRHDMIAEMKIPLPPLPEQQRIAEALSDVDGMISSLEKLVAKYKSIKTACLQQMFPQNGETVPRMRLPGFTGAWEQRKLGELVDVCSGRDYKHLSEGTIPVYGTGGYMLSVNDALSYDRDAIGIGRKGTIDRPYILKAPFWTVDTLFYAIPREKVDLNYAFDIFQNIDWKKKDESTGVPSLSKTAINDIDVLAPKHGEQQTIGQFFAAIDHLITIHQRKSEKVQKIKQGMMQQLLTGKIRLV